jgi:hypothetical protein
MAPPPPRRAWPRTSHHALGKYHSTGWGRRRRGGNRRRSKPDRPGTDATESPPVRSLNTRSRRDPRHPSEAKNLSSGPTQGPKWAHPQRRRSHATGPSRNEILRQRAQNDGRLARTRCCSTRHPMEGRSGASVLPDGPGVSAPSSAGATDVPPSPWVSQRPPPVSTAPAHLRPQFSPMIGCEYLSRSVKIPRVSTYGG